MWDGLARCAFWRKKSKQGHTISKKGGNMIHMRDNSIPTHQVRMYRAKNIFLLSCVFTWSYLAWKGMGYTWRCWNSQNDWKTQVWRNLRHQKNRKTCIKINSVNARMQNKTHCHCPFCWGVFSKRKMENIQCFWRRNLVWPRTAGGTRWTFLQQRPCPNICCRLGPMGNLVDDWCVENPRKKPRQTIENHLKNRQT